MMRGAHLKKARHAAVTSYPFYKDASWSGDKRPTLQGGFIKWWQGNHLTRTLHEVVKRDLLNNDASWSGDKEPTPQGRVTPWWQGIQSAWYLREA